MPESSSHQLVEVEEIKDNIVVLKNKNLRAVLMVSSLNFALKSAEEQQAIIQRFQDFLNSLEYTVQIVVQSRQLDISEYLAFLQVQLQKQTNELLKIQTSEYISFIEELIKLSNIMSKFFYVVVPMDSVAILEQKGFLKKIFPSKSAPGQIDVGFEAKKTNLFLRVGQVTDLLGTMGLRAIPLGREELMELYYTNYNPDAVLKQKNLEALIATGDEAKKAE